MAIDFAELRELLGAISQTDITEISLKTDEFELSVKKAPAPSSGEIIVSSTPMVTALPVATVSPDPAPVLETPTLSPLDQKWTAITSPMVGTFYRAPSPDDAPFVEAGDTINKEQTVCIIEAMKLMNEIESEVSGQVMEIVVANGEPVEYGQALMWVKSS